MSRRQRIEMVADADATPAQVEASLREVARRVGVSHAAPAHHFGDTTGLLTAVATEGFQHLHAAMTEAMERVSDPIDKLAVIARAYVEIAVAYPGHSSLMGRHDLVSPENQSLREWSSRSYDCLHEAVAAVAEEINPDVDVDNAPLPAIGDLAEVFSTLLVDGIRGSGSA